MRWIDNQQRDSHHLRLKKFAPCQHASPPMCVVFSFSSRAAVGPQAPAINGSDGEQIRDSWETVIIITQSTLSPLCLSPESPSEFGRPRAGQVVREPCRDTVTGTPGCPRSPETKP